MKKITISLLLLIASGVMFSQQSNPASVLTKQDYLQKSKNQKTAAWVLLGGGTAMVGGSIIWALQDIFSTSSGPSVLFVTGGVAMIGSIPLFIVSGKNKRKAMSLSFKMQQVPQLQNGSFVNQPLPSVNLKISL
jgi:uncharacterized membrane protein